MHPKRSRTHMALAITHVSLGRHSIRVTWAASREHRWQRQCPMHVAIARNNLCVQRQGMQSRKWDSVRGNGRQPHKMTSGVSAGCHPQGPLHRGAGCRGACSPGPSFLSVHGKTPSSSHVKVRVWGLQAAFPFLLGACSLRSVRKTYAFGDLILSR